MKKNTDIKKVTFSEYKSFADRKKEISECNIFGMVAGTVIIISSLMKIICSMGAEEKIGYCILFFGVAVFLLAVIYPLVYSFPLKLLKKVTNRIGKPIVMIFIFPVYVLLFLVSLFTKKRIKLGYGFEKWSEKTDTAVFFSDYNYSDFVGKKHPFFAVLYNLFMFFSHNKILFLLPIIIILMCIGFVFFFLSTSTVFSFVYTLF